MNHQKIKNQLLNINKVLIYIQFKYLQNIILCIFNTTKIPDTESSYLQKKISIIKNNIWILLLE